MSKPMYLHGREGSPKGTKGTYMRLRLLSGAHAPVMPATSKNKNAFDESFTIAKNELRSARPSIIVGSSFGGAILMKLIQEELWLGPSIFLAQAAIKKELREEFSLPLWDFLPRDHRALFIHARSDTLVHYQDSVTIKINTERRNKQTGLIHLWDAHNGPPGGDSQGNHRLSEVTTNGMLKRALEMMLGEVVEERSDEEFQLLKAQEVER
jgi:hypothetical protein